MDPTEVTPHTDQSPQAGNTGEPQRRHTVPGPLIQPVSTQPINIPTSGREPSSNRGDRSQVGSGAESTPRAYTSSALALAAQRPLPPEPGASQPFSRRESSPLRDPDSITRPLTGSPTGSGREASMTLQPSLARRATMGGNNPHLVPGMEAFVPVVGKVSAQKTVGERLQPTIDAAEKEKAKYAQKATFTGYALNVAIGLQVLLGALTTGISAALSSKQISLVIPILGGMSTMVASYLARTQGSHEPELSITRVKDLEYFLRDCHSFQMDHGHAIGTAENSLDKELEEFRHRFEELLGNSNGERKLSPA
ncbi:hypothetical protein HYDPIDRAFT_108197 [Hydnomerulius pinastri MD-312]|nr:hypothetical protein HYDPIDRAFT_108197 [Hydnomerulius pinastri MD-312]